MRIILNSRSVQQPAAAVESVHREDLSCRNISDYHMEMIDLNKNRFHVELFYSQVENSYRAVKVNIFAQTSDFIFNL